MEAKFDSDKNIKYIPEYEGLYYITSDGDVFTEKRQGTNSRKLKMFKDKKGYLYVSLCKNSIYKRIAVHRLVAMTFLENPNGYPCVNHKDEDKTNNKVENLEWCTYKHNNNYGTARQRAAKTRYRPCIGKWKDGTEKVYDSCTLASKDTGISQGNIWGACNGLWKHAGGVEWRYA